ncbi:glycosyltransferase family 2 protein [Solibacillus cecembensis]|uniref:glycosyltransferase family 2 protein n=1 Tax=Solibacillus cecembensis TaxID=459347 RepID=UPI003D05A1E1
MGKITVQIVTYNSAKYIKTCLDSVMSQSYPIDEIIIVDNNSTDNIEGILSEYQEITYIKNSNNTGFSGGHNQALKQSSSEYVLVLNPDIILDKDYIRNIILTISEKEDVGLATGILYRNLASRIIDSTGINMKKNRRAVDRGSGEVDSGQYNDQTSVFGVSGAAAIYKREMINSITIDGEFFDESFFAYKEDVDVSWRALIAGWTAYFVHDAVAQHDRGWKDNASRKDISIVTRKRSFINRYYYIMKNDQKSYLLLHSPFILLYDLIVHIYMIIKERELLGSWKLFKGNYKEMLQKRIFIQNHKMAANKKIYSFFKGIW